MRLLKVGDHTYTASYTNIHETYKKGFPQREKFLWADLSEWEVLFWGHEPIKSVLTFVDEHVHFCEDMAEELSGIDAIVVDNPLSALVTGVKGYGFADQPILVADIADWFMDMLVVEQGEKESEVYHLMAVGEELLRKNVKHWVFQSPVIRDHWERQGADVQNSIIIPNGFDQEKFGIEDKKGNATPTVLFVGKLGKWYSGLKEVIRALPYDWQMIVVGDGPCWAEISHEAVKRGKNVQFVGAVPHDEIPKYIHQADVCVMPVNDCSPIFTTEAMACGKVVVHQGDKIRWLIQDGKNGFISSGTVKSYEGALQWAEMLVKNSMFDPYDIRSRVEEFEWSTSGRRLSEELKGWVKK